MKIYENGTYRDMTEEEIAAMEKESNLAAIAERSRPMTESEVSRMLITQQINTLSVDDNTALRMMEFYPEWAENTAYTAVQGKPVGFKVRRSNKLWKLRQEHTSQIGWEPENAGTESLWEQINETHSGAMDDPIPYDGNMALENGKYYIESNEIYLCTRDTVNPVYNPLVELLDLYVEIA